MVQLRKRSWLVIKSDKEEKPGNARDHNYVNTVVVSRFCSPGVMHNSAGEDYAGIVGGVKSDECEIVARDIGMTNANSKGHKRWKPRYCIF